VFISFTVEQCRGQLKYMLHLKSVTSSELYRKQAFRLSQYIRVVVVVYLTTLFQHLRLYSVDKIYTNIYIYITEIKISILHNLFVGTSTFCITR
jgi:hypothetical protein